MLPSASLPALTLAFLPPLHAPPAPRRHRVSATPLVSAHRPPPRQPSRRRFSAAYKPPPRQPYRRRPAPAPAPPSNASPPPRRAGPQEELEEAIYDFMRRSAKPGAFPTRAELIAAGRADLAAAVASSGSWLSLGWSSDDARPPAAGPGVHPDYPPSAASSGLAPPDALAAAAAAAHGREPEASPSGEQPETEETPEEASGAGLEGMLTRLQRDRERARLPRRNNAEVRGQAENGALMNHNGARSHTMSGGVYTRKIPENGNIHISHSQNGTPEDNKSTSSPNDAWRRWSLDKSGFSDFQAAEIHPSASRSSPKHVDLDTALVQDDVPVPSNGVAISDYPSDHVDFERDEINARLQNLEVDLTDALKTLRSRFESVLSDLSNGDATNVLNGLSDDWEFEETKVMHAQEELRSIRAKIAVLEGKMALEIIERNKIIEEKQTRLDEVEKALSELRTVCIVWPNPASEVLLTGSFDGWTSQRTMERSERGIFSLNLRLYPGRYEIKFIVDGVWKNDPLRPTVNNHGNENNLLIVT